jgi:hypothetical protein
MVWQRRGTSAARRSNEVRCPGPLIEVQEQQTPGMCPIRLASKLCPNRMPNAVSGKNLKKPESLKNSWWKRFIGLIRFKTAEAIEKHGELRENPAKAGC